MEEEFKFNKKKQSDNNTEITSPADSTSDLIGIRIAKKLITFPAAHIFPRTISRSAPRKPETPKSSSPNSEKLSCNRCRDNRIFIK